MLFAFVAENKMGMDYGRLYYATKIADSDGKGKVSWMEFGRAASEDPYEMKGGGDEDAEDPLSIPAGQGGSLLHEDEIKERLSTWTFEDVFEVGTAATETTCATGFRMVDGACLKLKAEAKIAARLETVRFAKYLGASAEMFAGLEDVAYSREFKVEADGDRAALFMAFSSISAAQAEALPMDASPDGAVFVASLT
eukprot:2123292-Rhodomonas_salina.1